MNKIIGWLINKTKLPTLVKSLYGILKALIGVLTSIIKLLPEDKQSAIDKILEVAVKIVETVESICDSFDIDLGEEAEEEVSLEAPTTKTGAKKNLNKYLDKLNNIQGKLDDIKKK